MKIQSTSSKQLLDEFLSKENEYYQMRKSHIRDLEKEKILLNEIQLLEDLLKDSMYSFMFK